MYSKIFKSKEIRISNAHMKKLLRRFDINNFELVTDPAKFFPPDTVQMQSNIPCVLCESFNPHRNGCAGCPLSVFKTSRGPGCNYVLTVLLSHRIALQTYTTKVVYATGNKAQALEELKTVTNFLKSFKKE